MKEAEGLILGTIQMSTMRLKSSNHEKVFGPEKPLEGGAIIAISKKSLFIQASNKFNDFERCSRMHSSVHEIYKGTIDGRKNVLADYLSCQMFDGEDSPRSMTNFSNPLVSRSVP